MKALKSLLFLVGLIIVTGVNVILAVVMNQMSIIHISTGLLLLI